MRAFSNVVVLSSLLLAAVAVAGGTTPAAKAPTPAGTKTSTPAATMGSGSGSAAAPMPAGAGSGSGSAVAPAAEPPIDPNSVKPEDMPTAVRMRRLEQRTQALKERAWQLKARVQTLKEQMLGGGVGAQALISHDNEMGSSFHLVKLTYTLDGTQVFARTDDSGENLYKTKSFDIFTGPISPGNHQLAMVASYKGHGYGVFEYLSKFTFTARNTSSFTSTEGKISRVECHGFEKGGAATPMEKRAAIDCKVTDVAPEKAAVAPAQQTPGSTPLPTSTTAPTAPAGK
ncbi:hypothetical protein BH11MYX1_BH11MYX1_01230 [soil metagenome]